jgi:hypothetical protein
MKNNIIIVIHPYKNKVVTSGYLTYKRAFAHHFIGVGNLYAVEWITTPSIPI